METKIKIINKSQNSLPAYASEGSSGVDLRANIEENIIIKPLERVLIPTGIFLEIPQGVEAQIRPRSGLAAKNGITVLNTPGTIDADYRGEIKVILINLSNQDFTITNGDRICQMVFAPVVKVDFVEVQSLEDSERGAGGFGHSGIK